MSDTLVEASAGGDMKEDQPESLSVETAQPSLLKKGGLFGNSVAISPKAGDGSPSPAENSSQNGNDEVSSQSKNGDGDGDSGANGDNQDGADLEAANGDSVETQSGDDEVMLVEEPEEEEEKPAEESVPAVPAAPAVPDEVEEPTDAPVRPVEPIYDIEMADETEEDAEETEAEDAAEVVPIVESPKEDEEEKEEEKTDETAVEEEDEEMEEEKEPEEPKEDDKKEEEEGKDEVEEECVKKVISMDTDETAEEPAAEEPKADETLPLDTTQDEKTEAEEEAETSTPLVSPKRGRGRPPKSATGTPATPKTPAVKKTPSASKTPAADDEGEDATPPKRTPRGAAKKANEALSSPPPSARGRGRRSIKSDASDQPEAEEKEEVEGEKEEEDAEMKTPPTAGRGRGSLKTTPTSARRASPKGRKIIEEIEDIEEEDADEDEEQKEEEVKEEEEAVEETPRRGRRSAPSTPAAKKETPARGSKSAKKDEEEGAGVEKEADETSVSPSRRSTRGAASKSPVKTPKATPKGRGRKSSVKSEETVETEEPMEEEEVEEEGEGEEEKPKRGRGRGRKSTAKTTPTASAKKAKKSAEDEEDPFDMDTELDKHPEPLRNITVEKGSFGEMKYTRSPAASKSKYAATERSASDKVANLPNTPAATGTPKTIASAQSTRKSLGGTPAKRTPAARRKKGDEGEEEMEEDDAMEDGAMETPHEKKGRGRPAGGSTGRKRKASPVMSTSAKRAAVCVTIPELDAEAQWAADHPEDDSAPLVPGARVFAVFQKVFYPALVGERDGLGRYMVEFVEDKIVRPVPPAGVVPLSAVTIDKECLYQSSPDTDPVYCRVLRSANAASAKEWLNGAFRLQEMGNEEDEHDAIWTSLQLDMATTEWKKYVNAKSKMVTKINTDNITSLEDRRERRSRVHNDTAVALATLTGTGGTPEPTTRRVAGARKTPSSAGAGAVKSSADKKTPSSARRGRKPKAAAVVVAEEEEEGEEEKEKEEETEEKMETDEEEEQEMKKPEMNPRIFLNKTFILTSANRTTGDVVFKKNEMKKQILERGGLVVEDINLVAVDAEAYLISDTHYRTHKYLAAMSRGMPCLSHKWLIECVAKEELVSYDQHKLAGGQGLLNGDLYPLPDVRGKLLVGRTIMVHSKTDSSMKKGTMGFKQIWTPIVELLGATVVSDACLANVATAAEAARIVLPDAFEILLTDSSCQPEVVARLEKDGKAVVSSEWLIQSIIMGECPNFSAHPRFRYDSGNEPAKKEGSQEQTSHT